MKKIFIVGTFSTLLLSLSGCKFFSSLFGKGNGFKYDTVTKTEFYEITNSDLKNDIFTIPEKVSSNQNVFFIQVNTGNKYVMETGALVKNDSTEAFEDDDFFRSASSFAPEDLPVVNKVPSFVRNFKELPKVPSPNYSITGARAAGNPDVGSEKKFNIPYEDSVDSDFYDFPAELKYTSKYANIYFMKNINFLYEDGMEMDEFEKVNDAYLNKLDFIRLGDTFDKIFKAETTLLGENTITSYEGYIQRKPDKITILLTDIYSDSTRNQYAGTFGYFNPADFVLNKKLNDFYDYDTDHSNETQIIYIDSVLYKNYPETTLSTLTHEFGHLLNYCNKEMTSGGYDMDEATWFTEMLAMVTEDLMYSNYVGSSTQKAPVIKNRIPYYLKYPESGFTAWDGTVMDSDLIYYGNTYAYGSFLLRNYGGVRLLKEIATNKAVNEEAISLALKKCGNNVNYKDTLIDFAVHSMNGKISKDAVNSKTLNTDVKETLNGYDYHAFPIDVSDYGKMKIMKNENIGDLHSTGFSVYYAGKGVPSIKIKPAKSSDIKMYCVVQTVTE